MVPKTFFSILLLLVGTCQASPVWNKRNKQATTTVTNHVRNHETTHVTKPEDVDITSQILKTNKASGQVLIEGDLLPSTTKNAMICPTTACFWRKNSSNVVEVPYNISSAFSDSDRSIIYNAMATFHNKTCIRFVTRSNQTDYISIENLNGCYSNLGRIGGKQLVSLKRIGCLYRGIIQHELNHALGFYHEHTRSDRDQYVRINWKYINPSMTYNFQKQNTNNQNTPYDYGSVMHYGRTAFTIQTGMETITPIPDASVQIGQRQDLSNIDILRINKLYGC